MAATNDCLRPRNRLLGQARFRYNPRYGEYPSSTRQGRHRRAGACAAAARAYASCSRRAPAFSHVLSTKGETMNKKLIVAWVVLFVAWFMGSFVVHGALLHSDYRQLTSLFRAEGDQQRYFPLMILAHAMLSGAFVWIYAR